VGDKYFLKLILSRFGICKVAFKNQLGGNNPKNMPEKEYFIGR